MAQVARIAGLFIYPVKGCAGIALSTARLTARGLAHDRLREPPPLGRYGWLDEGTGQLLRSAAQRVVALRQAAREQK